jgi:formyl-CoA transferase
MALQGVVSARVPPVDAIIRDPMLAQVEAVRRAGGTYAELVHAQGSILRLMGSAFRLYYGGYEASDGAIIVGALTATNRDQIRAAIGLENDPTAAPDFNGLDPANDAVIVETRARIRAIFQTKTVAEWTAALDAAGAPASAVNLAEEMSDDPQVAATGLMLDLEHELLGPVRMVGPMVQMSATPTGSSLASPPLDAHTDAVLSELGVAHEEIADLRAAGVIGRRDIGPGDATPHRPPATR